MVGFPFSFEFPESSCGTFPLKHREGVEVRGDGSAGTQVGRVGKGSPACKENSKESCFVKNIGFSTWSRAGIGWKLEWNRVTEALTFRVRSGVWSLLSTEFCPETLLVLVVVCLFCFVVKYMYDIYALERGQD